MALIRGANRGNGFEMAIANGGLTRRFEGLSFNPIVEERRLSAVSGARQHEVCVPLAEFENGRPKARELIFGR